MQAAEVIEAYVRDVAHNLPRNKRNDVALELRSLLTDELAAKAAAAGRTPDQAMALELLRGFGRPAEAARRYHDRPPLIDPADTHRFLLWTVSGFVSMGTWAAFDPARTLRSEDLFNWLGMLLVAFSLLGWWRRRRPEDLRWRPGRGPDAMPRGLGLLALVATLVFPFAMYAAPQTFARLAFFGAIPTGGLELTEAFLGSWQRGLTLSLLGVLVLIYVFVTIHGGWRVWVRWVSVAAHAMLALMLLAHAAPMTAGIGGETFRVFVSERSNTVAAPILAAVAALLLLSALYGAYLESIRIRPAPVIDSRRTS